MFQERSGCISAEQAAQACHRRPVFADPQSALSVFGDCFLRPRRSARQHRFCPALCGRNDRHLSCRDQTRRAGFGRSLPGRIRHVQGAGAAADAVILRLAGRGRDTRPAGIGVPDIWDAMFFLLAIPELKALGKPAGRMADRARFSALLTERVSRHATSANPTNPNTAISNTSAIQNSRSARLMSAAVTSRRPPSPMKA